MEKYSGIFYIFYIFIDQLLKRMVEQKCIFFPFPSPRLIKSPLLPNHYVAVSYSTSPSNEGKDLVKILLNMELGRI